MKEAQYYRLWARIINVASVLLSILGVYVIFRLYFLSTGGGFLQLLEFPAALAIMAMSFIMAFVFYIMSDYLHKKADRRVSEYRRSSSES